MDDQDIGVIKKNFEEIIGNSEYNVEEKSYLNRIAFYTFKKYGFKSTFKKFSKFVTIIQVTPPFPLLSYKFTLL